MKKINFNSFMLLALAIMGLTFTSCGDDPVPGCTDTDGDNYAEANNEDDGSCTYFNLFEGDYVGTFECGGPLSALFSSANANVSKTADPNSITMLVSAESLPSDVPVGGNIDGKEKIVLDQMLPNQLLEIIPNPADPGTVFMGTRFDITVTGELVRQANGDLVGPLTFDLVEVSGSYPAGTFDLADTCTYTGVRQ